MRPAPLLAVLDSHIPSANHCVTFLILCSLQASLASMRAEPAAICKGTHLLECLGPQLSEALSSARVLVEGQADCGIGQPGLQHRSSRLRGSGRPLFPQTKLLGLGLHAAYWLSGLCTCGCLVAEASAVQAQKADAGLL